ncbi:hypothetical protein WI23_06275 [Burkholderia oklahomensis C6786]|nr:hypothetical protein WI23_06275 [Burkholderia oklahomensis C6786]KUY63685.1 hypothetical protein WI23_07400 [Burkholderia oklahomensis C6786]
MPHPASGIRREGWAAARTETKCMQAERLAHAAPQPAAACAARAADRPARRARRRIINEVERS